MQKYALSHVLTPNPRVLAPSYPFRTSTSVFTSVSSKSAAPHRFGAIHNIPKIASGAEGDGHYFSIAKAKEADVSNDKTVNIVYRYAVGKGDVNAVEDPHAGHNHRLLSEDDHAHGSGSHGYEWAGVFPLSGASQVWGMQKVDGAYADATMKVVIVPTTTPTRATMEAGEEAAETLIEGTCAEVEDGESMTPATGGSCFELHTGSGDDSTYTIVTTGLTGMAVYAQHVPTEFERDAHYLKDASGADVEPVAQETVGVVPTKSDSEMDDMHVDANAYYLTSSTTCSPTSANTITASEDFVCTKLNLTDTKFETTFGLQFPDDDSTVDKIFQFMTFFMGPKAFEWAGVFAVSGASQTWGMQKVNGAYADPSMRLVIIPTSTVGGATEEFMEEGEKEAQRLMAGSTCPEVEDGESMTPATGGSCFELHTGSGDDSTYTIVTTGLTGMAVYAQHVPTEFERDAHYLKDASGADVEPVAQEGADDHAHGRFLEEVSWRYAHLSKLAIVTNSPPHAYPSRTPRLSKDAHAGHDHGGAGFDSVDLSTVFTVKNANTGATLTAVSTKTTNVITPYVESFPQDKNLGLPIFASLIVNLVTLTGVIFLIPGVKKLLTAKVGMDEFRPRGETGKDAEAIEMKAVENGTSVNPNMVQPPADFAMPESLIMLTSAFSAGAILSCAYLLVLPEAFLFIQATEDGGLFWKNGSSILAGLLFPFFLSTIAAALFPTTAENSTPMRITFGVLVGDFFHNFADGCFIGVAFMNCDSTFGWTVAISSILHEIAQEIADFFTLTNLAGISPWKALALNFISGFSVMIGSIIVITSGMSDNTLGYILAIGGGIYVQIGAAECLPRAFDNAVSPQEKLKSMFMFAVGAILIGLVLMDHEHCEVGGGHEGHNH